MDGNLPARSSNRVQALELQAYIRSLAAEWTPNQDLRKKAADEGGFGDAADGEDHGAGARRNVMLTHGVHHLVERPHHDFLQPRIHFFLPGSVPTRSS